VTPHQFYVVIGNKMEKLIFRLSYVNVVTFYGYKTGENKNSTPEFKDLQPISLERITPFI
jgi:hypothetical protein